MVRKRYAFPISNGMDGKKAGTAVIMLLLILCALVLLFQFVLRQDVQTKESANLSILHSSEANTHSYVGSVPLASSCESLAASVTMSYQKPPKATITLSTSRQENEVCVQDPEMGEFDVAVTSDEVPEVEVSLNGSKVPFAIIEQ